MIHHVDLSHHPRALSNVFLDQFRPRHPDEAALGVVGHCSGQEGLTCTRRTIEEDTLERRREGGGREGGGRRGEDTGI